VYAGQTVETAAVYGVCDAFGAMLDTAATTASESLPGGAS
jgi:hypothetical protein